ncbi:MAG: 2-phospho-L-lactate transferase CofD family protein, partial [Acidobacteriota bacterium]
IVNKNLHLVAELADGRRIVGQHLITGREVPPIKSPIQNIFLTDNPEDPKPSRPRLRRKISELIAGAELICYPMGSFYSSVLANLLPSGVAEAVAGNDCPKIYIPNTGRDFESLGLNLGSATAKLLQFLQQGLEKPAPVASLLNFVLLDSRRADFAGRENIERLEKMGVKIIQAELTTHDDQYLNPQKLCDVLLSLV